MHKFDQTRTQLQGTLHNHSTGGESTRALHIHCIQRRYARLEVGCCVLQCLYCSCTLFVWLLRSVCVPIPTIQGTLQLVFSKTSLQELFEMAAGSRTPRHAAAQHSAAAWA